MAHPVDGFELAFTGRKTWKAYRYEFGTQLDIVPVTWTKGLQVRERIPEVWFSNPVELEAQMMSRIPFVVALAIAKDYMVHPHTFDEFRGIFEVLATGDRGASEDGMSIETKVLRRLYGSRTGLKSV